MNVTVKATHDGSFVQVTTDAPCKTQDEYIAAANIAAGLVAGAIAEAQERKIADDELAAAMQQTQSSAVIQLPEGL